MIPYATLDASMREDGGHILCLGAHCDDIDIGAGGTLLSWLKRWPKAHVTWVAFTSDAQRAQELHTSASQFLADAETYDVRTLEFRNGFFPTEYDGLKRYFETLKSLPDPSVIFTHQRNDRHQDHRVVSDLTWNTFRSNLILEYEIAKYDGGLEEPNAFVSLSEEVMARKIDILTACYQSQLDKQWFDEDLFRGLARLRGVESASESRFAEAFVARKLTL